MAFRAVNTSRIDNRDKNYPLSNLSTGTQYPSGSFIKVYSAPYTLNHLNVLITKAYK